jgi:vancomycin permeability regulator SanA
MDLGIEKISSKREFKFSHWLRLLFFIILIFILFFSIIIIRVQTKYSAKIVQTSDLKELSVGLVFGAGLKTYTTPSDILEDRILTAIKLYQEGKVGKFIMSGDTQDSTHNESEVMKQFAIAQGLPEEAILLDHVGKNTLISCKNVRDVFGLNKIVLVTQAYHLRRALYSCNEEGIDAVGIAAQSRPYVNQLKYTIREYLASVNAWLQSTFHF